MVMSAADPEPTRPQPAAPIGPAQFYELLIDSAKDYAIFAMDPQRRVTMWSAGAERIFGYSEAEMIGQSGDVIFTPEDRAKGAPVAEAATALAQGRAADERWHRRKNGDRFFAFGLMMPFRGPAGEHLGLIKINRDLTERKMMEEQLHASHEELESRVQERTRELRDANTALQQEIARRTAAETGRLQLSQRLATAEENERLRIARELHDEIGQHLAALMLKLNALEAAATAHGSTAILGEAQRLVETLGQEIHAIAVQLRPTALDDLGLAGAVRSYVELWTSRSGVPVHLHLMNIESPRLRPDIELALYRIVQEAFTNVLKHAAASRVSLVINRTNQDVMMAIEDNGRGFDPENASPAVRNGLGLVGMRERVAPFGGEVAVESQPGHGTTVIVRLTLHAA
jgi:PAS domain S-box-containing protein